MSKRARFATLFFNVVLAAGSAWSQTAGTGNLVGNVKDTTGAVIAAAKVSAVNTETAFLSETVTSAEGAYYVPYLAPGTYRLTIEAGGFKKLVRDGIIIRTGESPRIDVQLELGALTDSVTISGGTPLLDTETSTSGQTLSGSELVKLPVSQKTTNRMLWYYPGATATSGYHVLGQRQNAIGYQVDGIEGKEPGIQSFGGTDTQISTTVDAFEEVKVFTTGTPAEYGHSAGGMMSVVFKSGANQVHASLEDRYLGKDMIHRSYLEQLTPTNPFAYHEATALVSGPVILPKIYNGKDRTFWLFGWEKHVEIGGTSSAVTTVPTAAMYNGDFSFGGQSSPKVLPIYNPFTTTLVNGTYTRSPFPNNMVPRSLFDPAVQKFLAMNPFTTANQAGIPSATGPTQDLVMNQTKEIYRTRWDAKVDHQFTPNHRIFGRASVANHRAQKGDQQAQFAWRAIDPNSELQPVDEYNGVLSDMLILSPSMNNEFRAGYNRRALTQTALTDGKNWGQAFGIPNIGSSFPNFNIGYGLAALGDYKNIGDDITIQDNFTRIEGRHTLKAGYELIRTRYDATVLSSPGGSYTFGGTEAPFTPNTGNTFASFLLGTVSSATFTQNLGSWLPRWSSHQFYLQDDWRPLPNLSVNLGVRWSYETPFQTKYGQQSQFDPNAIDPLTGLKGAITHPSGALARSDWNNFAPRVGLSWNFRPKLVFRGSFGIVHEDIFAVTQNIMFDEYVATATVQANPGDPNYAFRLSDGPPNARYNVQANGSAPFVGSNYSTRPASWWDPNMRMPYVMNWSGGLQYEFARNWLVEMLYQGQSGVGLINNWNANTIPLNISSDPATLNTIYQKTQSYVPYPQFGAINFYSNFSHNTYHGGTVRLERRFTSGLAFNAFYTYSKTLTDVSSEGTAAGVTYYNRSLEKGRADYDMRHHFVSVLTYELPFGKGRRWMTGGGIANQVLGGWELAWTQTLQSGQPFTLTYTGSPNKYLPGNGSARPNIVTTNDQALVNSWSIGANRFPTSAQNPYLNSASFAYPAAFTAGTLGRNTFEGPGMNYTQLSLSKWWAVKERYRFQVRLDGYNFPFKQPNFANPSAIYNANSPGTFARMTGVQGSYSNIGGGRPSYYVSGRFQF
ncbi:MAG: hypothetical protein JWO80_1834 [Bryobacterales bacterium]|nr:hypothetical protein [Bryobacterales bacterium]